MLPPIFRADRSAISRLFGSRDGNSTYLASLVTNSASIRVQMSRAIAAMTPCELRDPLTTLVIISDPRSATVDERMHRDDFRHRSRTMASDHSRPMRVPLADTTRCFVMILCDKKRDTTRQVTPLRSASFGVEGRHATL